MRKTYLLGLLFLSACTTTTQVATSPASTTQSGNIVVDGKLFATLFQQRAAEYRALCFQAFNIARLRLDNYNAPGTKPRAIVTDIDETILDNSPYEAHQVLQGKDYDPVSWKQWTDKASADTLPGAASFLKYAASKGVTIFYITNRNESERATTLKNLQKFGLPNADDMHLMPRKDTSSKELRRKAVLATHDIVMLMGDNLADFSNLFDKKSADDRMRNTNFSTADFGNRFIVLPNPVYGDWEPVLYNYKKYTAAQKDSVLKIMLKTY